MKLSLGRTIIIRGGPAASNGTDRAPAIVTRVWGMGDTRDGPQAVNATAFPDLANHQHFSSLLVYDTEDDVPETHIGPVGFWPERV